VLSTQVGPVIHRAQRAALVDLRAGRPVVVGERRFRPPGPEDASRPDEVFFRPDAHYYVGAGGWQGPGQGLVGA